MAPVEIPSPATRVKRVRFVRNSSYAGVNYGPSYQAKEAEVREDWARHFVRTGRAEYVQESEGADDGGAEEQVASGGSDEGVVDGGVSQGEVDVLPDDLPGLRALHAAGIATWGQLAAIDDLTTVKGIGAATAAQIDLRRRERAGD
jgi:hypothetical protein